MEIEYWHSGRAGHKMARKNILLMLNCGITTFQAKHFDLNSSLQSYRYAISRSFEDRGSMMTLAPRFSSLPNRGVEANS